MGKLLKATTSYTTATNVTETAHTVASGDSFTTENFVQPSKGILLDAFITTQVDVVRMKLVSPALHDNKNGIQLHGNTNHPVSQLLHGTPISPRDTITPYTVVGDSTSGNIDVLTTHTFYEDASNLSAKLINHVTLAGYFETLMSCFVTFGATTSSGTYAGEKLMNNDQNEFISGRQYALLGATTNVKCHGLAVMAGETGNVKIVIPGNNVFNHLNKDYLLNLSKATQRETIPVFEMSTPSHVKTYVVHNENAVTPLVLFWFALLRKEFSI